MPDKGAVKRIGASFAQKAQENLRRRTSGRYVQQVNIIIVPNRGLHRGTKNGRIDIIRDVIDTTCIRWVCETIVSRSVSFSRVKFTPGNSTLLISRIIRLGDCQRTK
jgi:hypothetical protein